MQKAQEKEIKRARGLSVFSFPSPVPHSHFQAPFRGKPALCPPPAPPPIISLLQCRVQATQAQVRQDCPMCKVSLSFAPSVLIPLTGIFPVASAEDALPSAPTAVSSPVKELGLYSPPLHTHTHRPHHLLRFVLADTEKLHQKITQMSDRIRLLEDALGVLQATVTAEPHPLLERDLLKIKSSIELHSAVQQDDVPDSHDGEQSEYIDAFGTLALRDDGGATFYGASAGADVSLSITPKPSSRPDLNNFIRVFSS
jgi:hypothetical protein